MASISNSVGFGGRNQMSDVIVVQTLLSTHIATNSKLQKWLKPIPFHGQINGRSWSDPTVSAIVIFQREILGYPKPAGRIDPGGKTLRALEGKPFAWGPSSGKTSSEWEPYTKTKQYWASLSEAEKNWMAKAPTHACEAAIFKSPKLDGIRPLFHLAWKTRDPASHCWGHAIESDAGALHGWTELKTSHDSIRREHGIDYTGMAAWAKAMGLDCGVGGIAAMNAGMNVFMFHYVIKKGLCTTYAKWKAKRNLKLEGKAILEIVSAVVGGGEGAKRPKLTQVEDVRIDKVYEQIYNITTGNYGNSSSVNYREDELKYDEAISDGGKVIGKVRFFD